jgi:hypothetical protein
MRAITASIRMTDKRDQPGTSSAVKSEPGSSVTPQSAATDVLETTASNFYEEIGMRKLATLVAGALGYPENDRLLISDSDPAPTPAPTPMEPGCGRFERGYWDSDRDPGKQKIGGKPTAVLMWSAMGAHADVSAVSPIKTTLVDLLNHSSPEVLTRFASLVASHFAKAIQKSGGRRHYVMKAVMTLEEMRQQIEWFALLRYGSDDKLEFSAPRRVGMAEAMDRGLNFGCRGSW